MWAHFGFEHPLGDEVGYARTQRPEGVIPEFIS